MVRHKKNSPKYIYLLKEDNIELKINIEIDPE
jgi:hypothetical protein